MKLTRCVKPSHTLPEVVTSDEHIACVSKAWNTGRYMLFLLRRYLFVLRGKNTSVSYSSPQSSTAAAHST